MERVVKNYIYLIRFPSRLRKKRISTILMYGRKEKIVRNDEQRTKGATEYDSEIGNKERFILKLSKIPTSGETTKVSKLSSLRVAAHNASHCAIFAMTSKVQGVRHPSAAIRGARSSALDQLRHSSAQ